MRAGVLRHLPIFMDLEDDLANTFFKCFFHRGYQPGQTLYWEGDPGEKLFILAAGKVKLTHNDGHYKGVLIDILDQGEIFGNLTIDSDTNYRNSAQALTHCCALSITVEEFKRVLTLSPQLMLKTLHILSERAQLANERFLQAGTMPVKQRVARTLVSLARKMGKQTKDYLLIDVPLTRADIADMVGATQESVSRVLSQLHDEGIIYSGRQWVGIRDLRHLMTLEYG